MVVVIVLVGAFSASSFVLDVVAGALIGSSRCRTIGGMVKCGSGMLVERRATCVVLAMVELEV